MENNKKHSVEAFGWTKRKQLKARFAGEGLNRLVAEKPPAAGAVDRPGFDLGGSTGGTSAGTGIGLGDDAGETRMERSLPGRRITGKLSIPRWRGPDIETDPVKSDT
ncbi:hypothetical protein LGH82_05940 [Mesorhizobium sp. PAMC28654]|uniref:hypothetical protein n=1 Tax=Mesorhizobium sp. PAMC28654 TaxID=2880934 RepID=UPI001D0B96FC|nr:hypothetical protein [Mesorhizobium sp. PAMC28654]UDL90832.1 hypothetical protein LGH82_05940 [Mesorhizobium sp. PAMC28654]